ncbi:hypothetical protein ES707_10068 [subsurface metagenome]
MSHIVCPLCGLSVPLSKFWETIGNSIEDIEVVSFTGLGRGRGFEKSEAYSVLDDEEICEAVAARCYAILMLLGELEEEEDEG